MTSQKTLAQMPQKASSPMIQLDPTGNPPILSYNLPETVAFSGRNYMNLLIYGMDESWFEPVPASGTQSILAGISAPRSINQAVSMLGRVPINPHHLASGRVTNALASLAPDVAQTAINSGAWLQVYESSLTGNLTYSVIYNPDDHSGPAPYPGAGSGGIPPTEPLDSDYAVIQFTQPRTGAVITGPTPSIPLSIEGTAQASTSENRIRIVQVQVDEGAFQDATLSHQSDGTVIWTRTETITAAGAHTIIARSRLADSNHWWRRRITVNVELIAPPQPPVDNTPPSLTILSPEPGATIVGPAGAIDVNLRGTASDPSGIASVTVFVDRDGPPQTDAIPHPQNGWADWTARVTISSESEHRLTIRCIDNASNVTELPLTVRLSAVPVVRPGRPRLFLVEIYTLSSFLGNYGAGRVLKTFSLLPGERTRISIRTFTKTEQSRRETSSILDSLNEDSASDFESTLQAEQTNTLDFKDSFEFKGRIEGQGNWGVASVRAEVGISSGSNSARQEFAKNVTNTTNKHVHKVSSKREVQVNTSYEERTTTEEETSIQRELENINVSRTLNFIFRQMNQEFITLLHLSDVRVAYIRADTVNNVPAYAYYEATIPQLRSFLSRFIVEPRRQTVYETIIDQLSNIADYNDQYHSFIEEISQRDATGNPVPHSSYLRVRRDYVTRYTDQTTGTDIPVPGIIVAATRNVLRTDGIIVDSLLGQGEALDDYSRGLQVKAVEAREIENCKAKAEAKQKEIANDIVITANAQAAEIYAQVFPCCTAVEKPRDGTSATTPQPSPGEGSSGGGQPDQPSNPLLG